MKTFEDLAEFTQCDLLAKGGEGLDMIASANCHSFGELARKQNRSVHEVWRDVCAEAGHDECTFPVEVPTGLKHMT